jgi:tetratricopeptide (TPR) repeat protein/tRNA A-37 threonylcarbamoyl transferase component Bud32
MIGDDTIRDRLAGPYSREGQSSAADPAAPQIRLPTRFGLEGLLGRGGMADVYRAHDTHLDRPVAIKILRAELSDAIDHQRFRQEVSVTARLVHPGIVALFDSGECDGRLYYVMPLIGGSTLRERLDAQSPLPHGVATAVGADLAEALAYAHGAAIIHRDVKPENIFLVGDRALLSDFGIARRLHDEAGSPSRFTSTGMILGTLSYMSPEQIGGDDYDGRADLYSLGCVLYEMLSGAPPFVASSPMAVLAKHLSEPPMPIRDRVEMPDSLAELVMQLLAKDPRDRPAEAAEVAQRLRGDVLAGGVQRSETAARPADTSAPTSGPLPRMIPARPGHAPTEVDRLLDLAMSSIGAASVQASNARARLEEANAYLSRCEAMEAENPRVVCARGHWFFVDGHARTGVSGCDSSEAFARGRQLILRALTLDDEIPELHAGLAKVELYHADDYAAAEMHARRALELAPADTDGLRTLAIIEKILGRLPEATELAARATQLRPNIALLWNTLGDLLLAGGNNAGAVEALRQAIKLQPGYAPAMERLELARARLGEHDLAADLRVARLRQTGKSDQADLVEADVSAHGPLNARRRDIERELSMFVAAAESADPFADYFAGRNAGDRIITGLADLERWAEAMDWVDRAFRARPGRLRRVLTDQPFDRRGLARDPRYARLLRAAGLDDLL